MCPHGLQKERNTTKHFAYKNEKYLLIVEHKTPCYITVFFSVGRFVDFFT